MFFLKNLRIFKLNIISRKLNNFKNFTESYHSDDIFDIKKRLNIKNYKIPCCIKVNYLFDQYKDSEDSFETYDFNNQMSKINKKKIKNKNYDITYRIKNIYLFDLNSRILFYLFFFMIIKKKYVQLFFFSNFFFKHNMYICFDKKLINYLIVKLQNEIEISLIIIKQGFLFNSSKQMPYLKNFSNKKNLTCNNYNYLVLNNTSNNFLKLLENDINIYQSLGIFKKIEMNYYVNCYIKFLFYQDVKNLRFNSNFTFFSAVLKTKRYETLNYNIIKNLFFKFFNLLTNSIFLNVVPFFIFPKYLEEEVYIFYSYFLFTRKTVLYNIKYTRWLVSLRNLGNFNIVFGLPCFFFILDIINSFITISSVKNFKLPVGALVTPNVNANFFDYPIFISSHNKGCVYLYFLFIFRIVFYGLRKKKKFYWDFYIKYRILYELKKKLLKLKNM